MENEGRRKFLCYCLGGFTAAMSVAVAYPVYRYLAPRSGIDAALKVVIPEDQVAEGGAKFFEYAGSSAVLVKMKGGSLLAFSAVCTHLGCIVQWQSDKQEFLCPCHAGRYSAEGTVLAGPPPKPLVRLPFAVAGGNITVG